MKVGFVWLLNFSEAVQATLPYVLEGPQASSFSMTSACDVGAAYASLGFAGGEEVEVASDSHEALCGVGMDERSVFDNQSGDAINFVMCQTKIMNVPMYPALSMFYT